MIYALAGLFFAVVAWYLYRKATPTDITVPAPAQKRTDLLYGYYGHVSPQLDEARDHINLFMESQWEGSIKTIQNIQSAKMPTALDVSPQLFNNGIVLENASVLLHTLFGALLAADCLKYVKIIYPADEPNNTTTEIELTKAITIIRKVVLAYPELKDVKLAVIYAADKKFICQEMYDYVGFDDYDKKSSVLTGQYQELKKSLLPHQKTILVPGGSYGQDPVPFVNFAQANSEVGIVMPFVWFDDTNGNVGANGIRSGTLKQAYINAGKSII